MGKRTVGAGFISRRSVGAGVVIAIVAVGHIECVECVKRGAVLLELVVAWRQDQIVAAASVVASAGGASSGIEGRRIEASDAGANGAGCGMV